MGTQFCEYTKITKLYTLKKLTLGHVNYISIKMLKNITATNNKVFFSRV